MNQYETVKKLANECLESTKNLNNIVDLLDFCKSKNPMISHCAITSLMHIFQRLVKVHVKGEIYEWLKENIDIYFDFLLQNYSNVDKRIQVTSFEKSLMILKIKSELYNEFQGQIYLKIITKILLEKTKEDILEKFIEMLNEFDDLRFYFYKSSKKLVKKLMDLNQQKNINISATFKILSKIKFTQSDPIKMMCETSLCGINQDKKNSVLNQPEFKKQFADCWINFCSLPMKSEVYQQILEILPKVIQEMSDPTKLMDFLVDAYNSGGFVSILALNGLFTLITEYNLDYPNFYPKLYFLFDKNILHAKYRSRFFRLAYLFLSSSYIPSYLVAAFIKRMARLSLYAPPHAIVMILPMIFNLLRSHPSCITLIHRQESIQIQNGNI
jgi:U3 small nucleolar RNA-associated protein 19